MKKNFFAIIVLAAFTSCMTEEYTTAVNDAVQQRIVSISTSGLTATMSRASGIDIHMVDVDATNGAHLMTYNGKASDFALPLSIGNHRLMFYAVHGQGSLYPTRNAASDGLKALKYGEFIDYFLPGDNCADIWQAELDLTVSENTDSTYTVKMDRACAMLEMYIADAPINARQVAVVMDYYKYISIDTETALAKQNIRKQFSFLPRPQDAHTPNSSMLLITPKEYTTHINLYFLDANGGILTQRTISGVRIAPNQRTIVKGSLADDNDMKFSFQTEWLTTEVSL